MICCHDMLFILIVICIFATSNITTPELLFEGSMYSYTQTVALIRSIDSNASELCIDISDKSDF